MTSREEAEYIALRATIRERGTVRVCVYAGGLTAWAAATIATAALASTPVATLLPLFLLAGVFEAVFALHVGVERIGRYIQVFHETEGRGWEHAAMAFGRPAGAATTDALFIVPFLIATLFNLVPALLFDPARVELIFIGGGHALFALRLIVARLVASRQRAIDLARFAEFRTQNSELRTKN
jgi:hypothetical protein